ncbi:alpha/beta fold hydrolase [Streptosporangium sp. NPDC051022]|uniref:thioesterase II family protein n=1 Tax=Streptosporangium sp. NPDC051022 TaxID=3155752 RepID=UPI003442DB9F
MADLDPMWIRGWQAHPNPAGRIVCFGPAGASANFFRGWSTRVPADLEVLGLAYPGRERRFEEAPIEDMSVLADAVTQVLAPHMDVPTVLFGHSMGASVAFEVTRRLERRGRSPLGLALSGRQSPRRQRDLPSAVAGFDDERIIEHLHELGGTPPEMLADPDFRDLVLPAFRTDFTLIGNYLPDLKPVLDVPVTVLFGDSDREVFEGDADRWREITRRFTGLSVFPGGHFYLIEKEAEVVAHVVRFLGAQRIRALPWPPA